MPLISTSEFLAFLRCKKPLVRHVRIHPECSLCGCYFDVGDAMIALLGDRLQPKCRVIDASLFPITIECNQNPRTPWWSFCQLPNCCKCAHESESITVHRDCFKIFLQQTATHRHITAYNLWHAAHARYPWREFWPLPVTMLDQDAIDFAMTHAGTHWRMPLSMLPYELRVPICENLQHTVFWRCVLAREFVRKLIANSMNQTSMTTQLSTIASWKRGSAPKKANPDDGLYFRLTIDSRGLQEIERLVGLPVRSAMRSEAYAYVVDSVQKLGRILTCFQLGLARLYPTKGTLKLRSWDTPGPPVPPDYQFPPDFQPKPRRLGTIETTQSFGITFFICSGTIAAIHAHTTWAPSAYPCFLRLNPVKRKWVAWIFVPMDGGIGKYGFRARLLPSGVALPSFTGSLLLHMKISGEIVLGPWMNEGMDFWIKDDPTTLIHGISRNGAACPRRMAARTEEGEGKEEEEEGVIYRSQMKVSQPFEQAYFSYAELDEVVNVEVYHDRALRICRGVVVTYKNGGARALGQCRIGVDAVRVYERPLCFCYKTTNYLRQGTRVERESVEVECHSQAHHDHAKDGWTCCKLPGRLEWWFSTEESRVSFTPGSEGCS